MGLDGRITPGRHGSPAREAESNRSPPAEEDSPRPRDQRRPIHDRVATTPLEKAKALYAEDFREAIARGGYVALSRRGEAAIKDLLERSDEHHRRTGGGISVAKLLDLAEGEARDALREATQTLLSSDAWQDPVARESRARSAITATLQRAKAHERAGNAPAFERAAVRRETQAERSARARAAIEAAWKSEGK